MCYLLLLQRLVEHASAEAIGSCSGRGHPGGEGACAKPIGPTTTSPARLVDQAEPQPEPGPGPEPEPGPRPGPKLEPRPGPELEPAELEPV